jgi:hypothetical protein
MKLAKLFQREQITSLLSADSHAIVLSCLDPQTGAVTRVAISADMVALDDEALLMITTIEESEPAPVWAITPQGQEFRLRS